jgi:proteic killer suppression protein
MIRSFRDSRTALLADLPNHKLPKGFPPSIARTTFRKLRQIHAAEELRDLASPPGNRLEALAGDRMGQHSIRINDQWRICFRWSEGGADDVEVVDYHT